MFTLQQVQQLKETERRYFDLGSQLNALKKEYEAADRGKKGGIKRQMNLIEAEAKELGQVVFNGDVPQPESPEKAIIELTKWMEQIKGGYLKLHREFSEEIKTGIQYAVQYHLGDLLKAEYKWFEIKKFYEHIVEIQDPYEQVTEYIRIYNELMERWQDNLLDNARGANRSSHPASALVNNCAQEAIAELIYHFKGRWGRYDLRQERLLGQVEVWKVMHDNGLLEGEQTNG